MSAGGAGFASAYHNIRDYAYDAMEKKGWFDQAKAEMHKKMAKAHENEAANYSFGTEEMAFGEAHAIKAEYRAACENIMSERGVEGLAARFKELEKVQQNKVIAFTACAAIGVGAVVFGALHHVMKQRRDLPPQR